LESTEHPPIELRDAEGSSVLLLPFGTRVLGLFARDDGQNFFWANPLIMEVESARDLLRGGEWVNTGGDRTWLAPEVDILVGDLCDPWATYHVPLTLDPGQYLVERGGVRRI